MSPPIERVVVRLDAASETATAIDTAARLAARVKAPLHGIFVEDQDLLRLAGLPFARQITLGAGAEPLTVEQIELHLRMLAERARRDLIAAAKRHAARGSFEIVRGAADSALSGVTGRDFVVAGALSRPIAGDFRVTARSWSSLEAIPGPFLLVRHNWDATGSVVILLRDRSSASIRLLAASAEIAEARGSTLTVICPPALAGAAGFEDWVDEQLAGIWVRRQIEMAPPKSAALHQRIVELDCRLLAIEAGAAEGAPGHLREFVEGCSCDVLIVP